MNTDNLRLQKLETTFAAIFIGGNVPYEKLKNYVRANIGGEALPDDPANIPESEESGKFYLDSTGLLQFRDYDAVGGMFRGLENWLSQNGIEYDRINDELPGLYGAELSAYRKVLAEPKKYMTSLSANYEPLIPLNEVARLAANSPGLSEFQGKLRSTYSMIPDLDPVKFE